jgi:hypothetical protein
MSWWDEQDQQRQAAITALLDSPRERQLRAELGDVAILRERRGGVSRPLTLTELRQCARGSTTS